MAVRICPRIYFCGESISKNAFRRFESGYGSKTPKCIYKISKNFRVEKAGEISRNLRFFFVFSCLHLNQTRIMCLQVILDADFVLANLDAARWHTSPLVKQGLASDRDLPGRNAMPVNNLCIFIANKTCNNCRHDSRAKNDNNIYRGKYNPGYSCEKEPIAKAIKMSAEQNHFANVHNQRNDCR